MTSVVQLRKGNTIVEGYQSVRLDSSIGGFADRFSVTYSSATGVPVYSGDEVELRLGDAVALRGYVDEDTDEEDPERHDQTLSGRSYLGDLEDCSASLSGRRKRWRDITVGDLARALTADYGITVEELVDSEPIATFALKRSEKIAAAIHRACVLRGLWPMDRGGVLEISRAVRGSTDTVLREGVNIVSIRRKRNLRNRFREYRFAGQSAAVDVTSVRRVDGEEVEVRGQEGIPSIVRRAREVAVEVQDPIVTRTRRLEVVSQGRRRGDLGRRAVLERSVRSGRSDSVVVVTPGWHTVEGEVWRPGTTVLVDHRSLKAWTPLGRAPLLVDSVTLEGNPMQGVKRTTLTLVPPQTYDTEDQVSV